MAVIGRRSRRDGNSTADQRNGSDGYHRSNRPNEDVLDVAHISVNVILSCHSATDDVIAIAITYTFPNPDTVQ